MTHKARFRHQRAIRAASFACIALAIVALTGCAKPAATPKTDASKPATPRPAFPVTITDDASRTVTVKAAPKRIVSLAPANTEALFALGLGDKVVGVTSYDDYPAQVADIAKVGDFAGPNVEAVAAANPDLIVATTGVQADVIIKLEQLGATVVAFDPQSLDGLYSDINELGQITGTGERADALVADMQTKVSEVEAAVAGKDPSTAFIEIGQNPLFTAGQGTLIDELVTIGGGKNVAVAAGYVPYSTEELVKADPDVYLATKGTMSDPSALKKRAGFGDLSAVKNNRVVVLDDNLVTRPGPRIVEGLRQVAEGLHPEAFK
ncbi:MAG TPA: ABC transporter substrate-binding protein [Coriobacteriia bacterium]|nr:ABC transporter substrate-binding protein [Coriobacteriia bacterium]